MAESEARKLPHFNSDQELVEFFDSQDMGEYESALPEVSFDIDLKRSHYLISVDGYVMSQLLEISQKQQVSVEMLLDSWLKEKFVNISQHT